VKSLLILTVFLTCGLANATKARLAALNSSPHLTDEQLLFLNPIDLNYLDEMAAFETGSSIASASATSTSNGEVIVVRRWKEKSYAVALGHQNEAVYRTRQFINSLGYSYRLQQNPVHVFLAGETDEANWATSVFYSDYHDKVSNQKENTAGLAVAAEIGAWQVTAMSAFINKVEGPADKFDGSGGLSAGLTYLGDNLEAYATFTREPVKVEAVGTETEFHIIQSLRLGLVDSNTKEFNDLFWGGEINTIKVDCRMLNGLTCDQAFVNTTLPVWFGFESQATTWLKIRSSIRQTVLINQSRDEVGYPSGYLAAATGGLSEYTNGLNSTAISAGLGIQLNRLTIDGTLTASASQQLNSLNLLNQVSLKYVF
jgi:hypothetical protein